MKEVEHHDLRYFPKIMIQKILPVYFSLFIEEGEWIDD